MPFGRFEAALRLDLQPHALTSWARSQAGRDHLAAIGAAEGAARRLTLYGFGDQIRSSPCDELYVIRPRAEMSIIYLAIQDALVMDERPAAAGTGIGQGTTSSNRK